MRGVTRGGQIKITIGDRWHLYAQIKAVHQRARDPPQILLPANRHFGTGPGRIRKIAAFAGICRRNQQKLARIADMGIGTRHHNIARLYRLAQGFQNGAGKFGKLVHEQNAIMGQTDFTRFCTLTPPTIAAIEAV